MEPSKLDVDDLDAPLVGAFLDDQQQFTPKLEA
jgi:hypothetical protein